MSEFDEQKCLNTILIKFLILIAGLLSTVTRGRLISDRRNTECTLEWLCFVPWLEKSTSLKSLSFNADSLDGIVILNISSINGGANKMYFNPLIVIMWFKLGW